MFLCRALLFCGHATPQNQSDILGHKTKDQRQSHKKARQKRQKALCEMNESWLREHVVAGYTFSIA
jgi:hypothetical protein